VSLTNESPKRVPFLGKAVARIKRSLASPGMRGRNNRIVNEDTLRNVVYEIIRNDNEIRIGQNTRINNALIFIRGDHHRISVENDCSFGEGELWLEEANRSLIIHRDTMIERSAPAVRSSTNPKCSSERKQRKLGVR
jgi:hypothetical protein